MKSEFTKKEKKRIKHTSSGKKHNSYGTKNTSSGTDHTSSGKMILLRILCLIAGLVCVVLFTQPILRYGIIKIGNLTGLAAGGVFLTYAVFANVVNKIIAYVWQYVPGKIFLCLVGACAFFCVVLAGVISCFMISAANITPAGDETIIVLGCQVRGTSPSLMLGERLTAAENYLSEHTDAKCILSGGKGSDEGISEALCMYNYLTTRGISPDRLYMEDRSTSTRENLRFSLDIIEKEGLNRNIAIVTNEFHEYRAIEIAKKLDLTAASVPAKTHWWMFATYSVREWFGIIYEWLNMG